MYVNVVGANMHLHDQHYLNFDMNHNLTQPLLLQEEKQ
jgi:hypothetical protein